MTETLSTNPESGSAPNTVDDISYSYRPSLLGASWSFRLGQAGLAWEAGRRSGVIPYRDIRRVRLSFKPASMQTQRYLCEIWAERAPKLDVVSSSWKSMVEQEAHPEAYSAFVRELHRRIALAQAQSSGGMPTVFDHGRPPYIYWLGLAVFVAVALGLAWLSVRALQTQVWGAAAFIGFFMLLFLWQGGNFFRRNRPGLHRADSLPESLMPK